MANSGIEPKKVCKKMGVREFPRISVRELADIGTFQKSTLVFGRGGCFLAVRATRPTAWSTHAFFKLRARPLNMLSSGFRLLDGDNPAYPFVAGKRRNILPCRSRRWVGSKRLS
jgi:hypothetical protein